MILDHQILFILFQTFSSRNAVRYFALWKIRKIKIDTIFMILKLLLLSSDVIAVREM